MMSNQKTTSEQPKAEGLAVGLLLAAGLVAVATRLLTAAGLFPWNLTPVGALALYGGARLRSWRAFVLPIGVMVVTDLVLWAAYAWSPFNPFVYASFLVYVLLGRLLTRTESPAWIGGACVAGTIQFFLLTNLSVWLAFSQPSDTLPSGQAVVWKETGTAFPIPVYARNLPGLVACYAIGLPFAGNTLMGDLFFGALLFGAHAWLSRRYSRPLHAQGLASAS
jgi:Family of unknown function (DUF6580)